MSTDTKLLVGHTENFKEIWDTLDMCYERPAWYISEAPKPIIKF